LFQTVSVFPILLYKLGELGASLRAGILRSFQRSEEPPRAISFVLELTLLPKVAEDVIGDLEERYRRRIVPRYGAWAATLWYAVRAGFEVGHRLYTSPLVGKLVRSAIRAGLGVAVVRLFLTVAGPAGMWLHITNWLGRLR